MPQLDLPVETEHKKRVSIYITDDLQTGFESAFEYMKQQGIVPQFGNPNKYRTAVIQWCVQRALEGSHPQEVSYADSAHAE